MRGTRDGSVSTVGGMIDDYLRSHGLLRTGRECMVPILWGDVVGEWYQKHTRVLRVDKGVVTVRCDSSARAQQLQLDSADIIRAINERLRAKVVKQIRPTSGGIASIDSGAAEEDPDLPPMPTAAELDGMDLTADEEAWVKLRAEGLEDNELKQLLVRVLTKQCRATRWLVEHGYTPCERCTVLVPPGRRLCRACAPGRLPSQGSDEVIRYTRKPDTWEW